jgi:biotin carboxylase
MNRPVVIINPLSSGTELAPAFRARGIPAIAVTFPHPDRLGFGSRIQPSDFIETVPADHPDLEKIIKACDPIAIIPGTEDGIALAERLTAAFTPQFANDPHKSLHRTHKALMQAALDEAGVPALKTLNTASEPEAAAWIRENGFDDSPFIIKPPVSAGSDKVFHIPAKGDWRKAFNRVLAEPSKITGRNSETVVIQEQAVGTEYAVGTVSANGNHSLAHLIKYSKTDVGERKTVFDHVEFVPYDEKMLGELFVYTQKALDALGVRWGAAHTEIMLTSNGPRLIESGARMCGGPVVGFARKATGSSQADKLVEVYVDGDVHRKEYVFRQTVVPVFLKAVRPGTVLNAEVLDGVSQLPTLLSQHIWIKNGDFIRQTEDYLTSIGIVALTGERDSVFMDYEKIRNLESRLLISTYENADL